ncbi:MAG: hypothetical protein FJX68_08865 [Alphaproteobacteria bacterium]|nr:hypothetical protein [Alphaproteobacteria bacterium]
MSLEQQLAAIREAAAKRVPPERRAVMQRATADLRASGIMQGVLKVGDRMPDFSLLNAAGTPVSSAALLAKGPLVVSTFRGSW